METPAPPLLDLTADVEIIQAVMRGEISMETGRWLLMGLCEE